MATKPELVYPGKTTPGNGDYPNGSARDITVTGDGTGTPWRSSFINEWFGFNQAILRESNIEANGQPETSLNSQYLQGLIEISRRTSSSSELLRSASPTKDGEFFVVIGDNGRGVWSFDESDTVTPDNSIDVIVTSSGLRIKKIFDGLLSSDIDFQFDQVAVEINNIINDIESIKKGQLSGHIGYLTLDQLESDLLPDDKSIGEVLSDGDNNGVYLKQGASNAGSWIKSQESEINSLTRDVSRINESIEFENLTEYNEYNLAITDNEGYFSTDLDERGIFKVSSINVSDVVQSTSYGQSGAIGATAAPSLSTTQNYLNITFNGGVFVQGDNEGLQYTIPLVSDVFESPATTPNHIVSSLIVDGFKLDAMPEFLSTSTGLGSTNITFLSKGSVPYSWIIDQANAGKLIAESQGKSYEYGFVTFNQGERDNRDGTSRADYLNLLITLYNDLNNDLKIISGNNNNLHFATSQVSSHYLNGLSVPSVALAQLDASRAIKNIHLSCPMYIFDYNDGVHIDNLSQQQLSKYYANSIKKTYIEGDKYTPLSPSLIQWLGERIVIHFDVPYGVLNIDGDWVSMAENYGFDIRDENGLLAPNLIESVSLLDSNKIVIITSSIVPIGHTVNYGFGDDSTSDAGRISGARGNLRDQYGDIDNYIDDNGVVRRMDNYCVIFSETRYA